MQGTPPRRLLGPLRAAIWLHGSLNIHTQLPSPRLVSGLCRLRRLTAFHFEFLCLFLQVRHRRNHHANSINKPTTPQQLVQSQLCRVKLLSTPCSAEFKAHVHHESFKELVLAAGTCSLSFRPSAPLPGMCLCTAAHR